MSFGKFVHRCGNCSDEFTPRPGLFGAEKLCPECLSKAYVPIQEAQRAFYYLSQEDQNKHNFDKDVLSCIPDPKLEIICGSCHNKSESAMFCSCCQEPIFGKRGKEHFRKTLTEYQQKLKDI